MTVPCAGHWAHPKEAFIDTIIGATGLVGSHLLGLLLEDERVTPVAALGWRPTDVAHAKLRDEVVDFRAPESFAARRQRTGREQAMDVAPPTLTGRLGT